LLPLQHLLCLLQDWRLPVLHMALNCRKENQHSLSTTNQNHETVKIVKNILRLAYQTYWQMQKSVIPRTYSILILPAWAWQVLNTTKINPSPLIISRSKFETHLKDINHADMDHS
jgi:hypothetical protein